MNISILRTVLILLSFLVVTRMAAQSELQVTGTVVGVTGQPISEVSISIEGSDISPFVTGEDGKFSITVENGNAWLKIQPIGALQSKSIFLNNRNELKIYLSEEGIASGHEEILYSGARSKARRNIISSYSKVEAGQLHKSPYQTIDQYFQGNVPGINFTNHSGLPGTGGFSFVRGIRSMHTNNQPLYILDGFPIEMGGEIGSLIEGYAYNPLATLDPLDITDITILKDANESALYGSKGSNGVVLIETLKPTETQTTIDFVLRTGVSSFTKRLPQLSSDQYKTLANELLISSGSLEEDLKDLYPGLYYANNDAEFISAYKYSHETNWQDEIFSRALYRDVYMSVKGGDAIAQYGLSVGYLKHDGIIAESSYDRFNTRFVGTFNIFQWLRMFVSSSLTRSSSNFYESALQKETNPILNSLFKSPQLTAFQWDTTMVTREMEDGGFVLDTVFTPLSIIDTVDAAGVSNPTAIIENLVNSNTNFRSLNSFRIEGDISSSLKFNSIFGINLVTYKEQIFWPNKGMGLYYDNEAHNVSKEHSSQIKTIYNDNHFSYTKQFNDIHDFTSMVGVKWQTNRYEQEWGISMNSPEDDSYTLLGTGPTNLKRNGGATNQWNWMLSYANLGYTFKDKYLLNMNISGDLSSRTGNDADVLRIGNIPLAVYYNLGAGWRLSNEQFMKNQSTIEELKLRASYGVSGNDDIGNTTASNYYFMTHYRNTTGLLPSGFANTTLSPEKIKQLNAGIDFGLLGNRIFFTFDVYEIRTDDMLIIEKQNEYIGYQYYYSNNAALTNKGWETYMFGRVLSQNSFTLDMNINLGHYSNEVTQMPGGESTTELDHAELISRIGEPVNSFYGYNYLGVYSTSEEASSAGPDNNGLINERNIPFGAGDAEFEDVSGPEGVPDGVINELDKVILGSPNPDLFGGLNAVLSYKRWSLNVFWQFATGQEIYNHVRYENEKMSDLANQSVVTLRRWTYEGQETDIPGASWNDPIGNNAFSSRWIEDGSYLRLKEVTLSYTVNTDFAFFRNLNLYIMGCNLLTFTNYLGYDPEFSYSFDPMRQGIDYGLMPQSTRFMVGAKFGL